MDRFQLTRDMNIGWNLGNTFDAYPKDASSMLPPLTSETLWRNPVTTKRLIDTIAKAGFDVLRVPTTWDKHFLDEPGYPIDPKWMARVREVVFYGLNNDMRVILNMHHESWHFPSAENKQPAQDKLTALWTQIAEAFKDIGDELIFEGLNEPRMKGTPLEWQGGTPEARLRRGTPVLVPADDVYTNHIHADDLARACVAALWRGAPQRVYHASDDSDLRMGDYFDLAADLYGLPARRALPAPRPRPTLPPCC